MNILTNPRPNRLEEEKDEDYHVRYARWCIGNYNVFYYQDFVSRYLTNVAFYRGNQWIFKEDLEAFLMDESGEVRNRVKLVQNIIKPFVDYYRGAAIRMDINAEVITQSRETKNRRNLALDRVLFWSRQARKYAESGNQQAAQMIEQQFNISRNEAAAIDTFNNLYVDELVKKGQNLFKYIKDVRNNTADMKMQLATYLALSGLGVLKEVDFNGEQIWEITAPHRFIFDNTCESPNLDDAEYMGEFKMWSATDVYEMYPNVGLDSKKLIEQSISNGSNYYGIHNVLSFYYNYSQKAPVYEMYWRDVDVSKYAAFYDRFGYPILEEVSKDRPLNEAIPAENLQSFVNDYAWIKDILNEGSDEIDRNNKVIEVEQVRFCNFVPREYILGGNDIVLEYGKRKYSQKNQLGYRKPDFPYKASTYSYILGEIMSPLDSLISVAESHVNNSRGSGTVIDKDSLDPQGGEEEAMRNMNLSKPVLVNAQRQVNNVIGSYDGTIKAGTLNLFSIATNMKNIANDIFGSGGQMTGGEGAYRANGSVAQINMAQGTIMQEPFFKALEQIYMQSYNSMLDRGKRIYLANKRKLSFIVGDDGVETLEMTDDMLFEDFNARIIRSADFYTERESADQMLMIFRDKGMIDDKVFASLYRNATMMDVAYALRGFVGLKAEAEKAQAQNMEVQQQANLGQQMAVAQMQDDQQNKMMENQNVIEDKKNAAKIISSAITTLGKEQKQKTE
jgi:hypothetical protein